MPASIEPSNMSERAVRSSGVSQHLVHLLPKSELLNGEVFYSLAEAKIVIESWRQHDNTLRPHSSFGYRPSAPTAVAGCFAPNDCRQAYDALDLNRATQWG